MANATKKCKYCKTEIPKDAKICPNCKKKQGLKVWQIVLIVFVVLAVIGAFIPKDDKPTSTTSSQNQASTSSSQSSQSSEEESSKEETEKTEFAQGETVNFKGVEYTVTNVEKTKGNEIDSAKDGYEYVIVSIKIENKSDEKIPYSSLNWKMENSNGQEEGEAITIVDSDTALDIGELNPGGNVEGTISFEEPEGDTGLKLNFYDNILITDEATFSIVID